MGEVNITRAAGQLKITNPSEDNVFLLCLSGVAVADKIALGEPHQIFSIDELPDLGITPDDNPLAYRDIMDFYAQAGNGAELNFMLFSNATSLKDVCDVQMNIGKKLVDFTGGRAVVLVVNIVRDGDYVAVIEAGFDKDINDAKTKAQALCVAYQLLNIPLIVILPGQGFSKDAIADIPMRSTLSDDYVSVNTWCLADDGIVSQGMLAGWLTKFQVHQNIARVLSGKVADTAFMPDGTPAATLTYQWATLALKGLLFPIKRLGKSGFYYKDDPCVTAISSDYSSISWNRVINKVQRLVAAELTNKLNSDFDVNPTTGQIESSLISDWQGDAENAVKSEMVNVSYPKVAEISGIKVLIAADSDVLNNSMDVTVDVVRKGQVKQFNCKIGYTATI